MKLVEQAERNLSSIWVYFVNRTKTWLIVKKEHMSSATDLFHKEGIQITLQGRRHLGAALGSRSFTEEYVTSKVTSWVKETVKLTTYVSMQPATYSLCRIYTWP